MEDGVEKIANVHTNESASKSTDANSDSLLAKTVTEILEAAQSKPSQIEEKLHQAERDLNSLKKSSNDAEFSKVLQQLNERVNSPTDREQQFLPFLELAGIDPEGHIIVKDWSTGAVERLSVENGVLGPEAAVDESEGLYSKDGSVSPAAIEQGRLADCYFLAALQSLAQHSPESIKAMIQESSEEGTNRRLYTVTFAGDKEHPVTVSAPTIYETTAFNQNRGGLWACIIEKAHRKLTGNQLNDPGGDSADAMKLLLGHDATSIPMNYLAGGTDTSDLTDFMQKIIASNHLFTVETKYDVGHVLDSHKNSVALDPKHQYSLVSFDSVSHTVTLRNPHGSNDVDGPLNFEPGNMYVPSRFDEMLDRQDPQRAKKNEIGGLLTIDISDFAKNFESIVIAPAN